MAEVQKIRLLRSQKNYDSYDLAKEALAKVLTDKGQIAIASYGKSGATQSVLGIVDEQGGKTYITGTNGEIAAKLSELTNSIAANKSAIDKINGTGEGSISKAVSDAKSSLVNSASEGYQTLKDIEDKVKSKVDQSAYDAKIAALEKADTDNLTAAKTYTDNSINDLDVSNNTSEAVKGITITVNEVNGKVQKPVIAIADGAVSAGNGNLVTGGVVRTAIDDAVKVAVGSVYKVKGTVDSYDKLPKDASNGDVYNVTAAYDKHPAGTNWVWVKPEDGDGYWDALGGTVDLSPYAKTADLKSSQTGEGSFVKNVSQADGKVSVTMGGITAEEVPTLAIAKISGLQTALDAKVNTTTTVNRKELSGNITLAANDMLVGGDGAHKASNTAAAIEDLYLKADSVAGSISTEINKLDATVSGTSNGVKVTVVETDGKLESVAVVAPDFANTYDAIGAASAVDNKLTAFSGRTEGFATSAQGGKADTALQSIGRGTDGTYVTTTVSAKGDGTTQNVGVAVTTHAIESAVANTADGLAVAADVKAYVDKKAGAGSVVTSISGKHGAFTFAAAGTTNSVNLSVSDGNVISAALTDIDCGTF